MAGQSKVFAYKNGDGRTMFARGPNPYAVLSHITGIVLERARPADIGRAVLRGESANIAECPAPRAASDDMITDDAASST